MSGLPDRANLQFNPATAHSSDGEYASDFDDLSAGALSPQRSVLAVENPAQATTVLVQGPTDKTADETGDSIVRLAPELGENLQRMPVCRFSYQDLCTYRSKEQTDCIRGDGR